MSVRLGIGVLHEVLEVFEEVPAVVRTRTRFGVVLHAERRNVGASKALHGVVIEVDVGQLSTNISTGQRGFLDGVVVVL